jgi:sugar phosphate permease
MVTVSEAKTKEEGLRGMPRNVWAVSAASFFMDISSEMVINILPLFLANVLGVQTSIIGVIEGLAETTASLLKIFSGWLSDKLHARKWLAVSGYALSAVVKPLFYFVLAKGSGRPRATRLSRIQLARNSADLRSDSIAQPTPPARCSAS